MSYKMLGLIRHFHICIYAYYDYLNIYKSNIYLKFEVSEQAVPRKWPEQGS